jgi:hypothetical protein
MFIAPDKSLFFRLILSGDRRKQIPLYWLIKAIFLKPFTNKKIAFHCYISLATEGMLTEGPRAVKWYCATYIDRSQEFSFLEFIL